jgi:hypothetical protein
MAICLGGLGAALLYANLSGAASVIVIKHTVYRDQVISADDLAITALAAPPGVETVPGDRLGDIVGKTALTDLGAGGLLSPKAYGDPVMVAGVVRVGLRLEPGRLPNTPLLPGTSIQLVPVAREGTAVPAGPSVAAVTASMPLPQSDGSTLIDVTVGADAGVRVAQLAAAGQLSIIRLAPASR